MCNYATIMMNGGLSSKVYVTNLNGITDRVILPVTNDADTECQNNILFRPNGEMGDAHQTNAETGSSDSLAVQTKASLPENCLSIARTMAFTGVPKKQIVSVRRDAVVPQQVVTARQTAPVSNVGSIALRPLLLKRHSKTSSSNLYRAIQPVPVPPVMNKITPNNNFQLNFGNNSLDRSDCKFDTPTSDSHHAVYNTNAINSPNKLSNPVALNSKELIFQNGVSNVIAHQPLTSNIKLLNLCSNSNLQSIFLNNEQVIPSTCTGTVSVSSETPSVITKKGTKRKRPISATVKNSKQKVIHVKKVTVGKSSNVSQLKKSAGSTPNEIYRNINQNSLTLGNNPNNLSEETVSIGSRGNFLTAVDSQIQLPNIIASGNNNFGTGKQTECYSQVSASGNDAFNVATKASNHSLLVSNSCQSTSAIKLDPGVNTHALAPNLQTVNGVSRLQNSNHGATTINTVKVNICPNQSTKSNINNKPLYVKGQDPVLPRHIQGIQKKVPVCNTVKINRPTKTTKVTSESTSCTRDALLDNCARPIMKVEPKLEVMDDHCYDLKNKDNASPIHTNVVKMESNVQDDDINNEITYEEPLLIVPVSIAQSLVKDYLPSNVAVSGPTSITPNINPIPAEDSPSSSSVVHNQEGSAAMIKKEHKLSCSSTSSLAGSNGVTIKLKRQKISKSKSDMLKSNVSKVSSVKSPVSNATPTAVHESHSTLKPTIATLTTNTHILENAQNKTKCFSVKPIKVIKINTGTAFIKNFNSNSFLLCK